MLKPILIAAALSTFGAAAVYAAPPDSTTKSAPTMQDRATMSAVDAEKLIGRKVRNAQDQTVGDIESIYLNKDGQVDSVIIGVGGFLGIGERDVRVAWKDLAITNNGETVTTAMTKAELKALPEYKYRDAKYRGKVFSESGVYQGGTAPGSSAANRPMTTPGTTAAPPPRGTTAAPPPASATGPTRTFNADGNISTEAVLKASVRNTANETIGEVEDVYVDKDGKIRTVVVSVGGFLGMGDKNVAVKWDDLRTQRDGNKLILLSSFTKEQLNSMPKYDYGRQQAEQK